MKKKLTAANLARIGGFTEEIERFENKFPKGMDLTGANLKKLDAMGIRVSWILARCLHDVHWNLFCITCGNIWGQFCSGELTEAERDCEIWDIRAKWLSEHWEPKPLPRDEWAGYGYYGD